MNRVIVTAITAAIAVYATNLSAGCPTDGAKPFTIGPANPQNGFPQWLQDANGLSLELCLDSGTHCVFDPIQPDNPFSTQIGFGAEGFWWLAESSITQPNLSATLVMAAEAAFLTESPAAGQQFPFTRLRIRADVPAIGNYTVTHPFGEITFPVAVIGAGREINDTIDLPFTANSTHQGRIGPFLKSTSAPAGYLGNGTATPVTGSPCGNNIFRISGVSPNGTPINLDGAGGNALQTDQFTVIGKLFSGVTNTPMTIERSSYSRNAAGNGQVAIFATAPVGANVTVSGEANLPTVALPLTDAGNGSFSAHIALSNASTLPPVVKVTAKTPTNAATTLVSTLSDQVNISVAEYNFSTSTLTVKATSSDLNPQNPPQLTLEGFGTMSNGIFSKNLTLPPATITVTSSAGGSDTEALSFTDLPLPTGNTPPIAVNDELSVVAGVPKTINVLANDSDADHDALKVVGVTQGNQGSIVFTDADITYTPAAGFTGSDTFTYTVQDVKTAQATATVAVTISPASTTENLLVSAAECRTNKQEWRVSGSSTAPEGTLITLFAGASVIGATRIGEGQVNNLHNWVIRERNSPVVCSSPISVISATGAVLENIAVNVGN